VWLVAFLTVYFEILFLCLIIYNIYIAAAISDFTETDFTLTSGTGTVDINGVVTASVSETATASATLFTLAATKEAPGNALTYAFASGGNPSTIASIATSNDVATISLVAANSLDFETTPTYVFVIEYVIFVFTTFYGSFGILCMCYEISW